MARSWRAAARAPTLGHPPEASALDQDALGQAMRAPNRRGVDGQHSPILSQTAAGFGPSSSHPAEERRRERYRTPDLEEGRSVGTAPPTRSGLGEQRAEVPAHCSAENLCVEVTAGESRVDGPMRDEYPRASDVPGGVGAQKEDRHAREDEGAIVQVEPRPRSIDFDRVAVQIVRDLHEDLTGEEPLGKRAARWKVAPITLHPCRVDADGERADPRQTWYRACLQSNHVRRRYNRCYG